MRLRASKYRLSPMPRPAIIDTTDSSHAMAGTGAARETNGQIATKATLAIEHRAALITTAFRPAPCDLTRSPVVAQATAVSRPAISPQPKPLRSWVDKPV